MKIRTTPNFESWALFIAKNVEGKTSREEITVSVHGVLNFFSLSIFFHETTSMQRPIPSQG